MCERLKQAVLKIKNRQFCNQLISRKKAGSLIPSPEAFIFPNEDRGFVDPGNYLKRVLKKLAKEIGLPKLTFQVSRRTIAALGPTKGTVKSVQGMLRHNRTAATTDVYMQGICKLLKRWWTWSGSVLHRVLIIRKLLILRMARRPKMPTLPGRLYDFCTVNFSNRLHSDPPSAQFSFQ